MSLYQQGDILFAACGKRSVRGKTAAEPVVALGEATGHAHRVKGKGVKVRVVQDEGEGGTFLKYLEAPNGATVHHEEHGKIELPAGNYKVSKVREYDHFAEAARDILD